MLVLELDLVLLGRLLLCFTLILALILSRGGEGEASLSEESSTEFLLSLKFSLAVLEVFFRKYLAEELRPPAELSVSSLIRSESDSSTQLRFFRSSLVAEPYSILFITSEEDLREPTEAMLLLLPPIFGCVMLLFIIVSQKQSTVDWTVILQFANE